MFRRFLLIIIVAYYPVIHLTNIWQSSTWPSHLSGSVSDNDTASPIVPTETATESSVIEPFFMTSVGDDLEPLFIQAPYGIWATETPQLLTLKPQFTFILIRYSSFTGHGWSATPFVWRLPEPTISRFLRVSFPGHAHHYENRPSLPIIEFFYLYSITPEINQPAKLSISLAVCLLLLLRSITCGNTLNLPFLPVNLHSLRTRISSKLTGEEYGYRFGVDTASIHHYQGTQL
jgi:hypothetical protein